MGHNEGLVICKTELILLKLSIALDLLKVMEAVTSSLKTVLRLTHSNLTQ